MQIFLLAAALVGLLPPVGSSTEVVALHVGGSRCAEGVARGDITGSKGSGGSGSGRGGVHTHGRQDSHDGKSDGSASAEHDGLVVVVVGVGGEGDGMWSELGWGSRGVYIGERYVSEESITIDPGGVKCA